MRNDDFEKYRCMPGHEISFDERIKHPRQKKSLQAN